MTVPPAAQILLTAPGALMLIWTLNGGKSTTYPITDVVSWTTCWALLAGHPS